MLGQVVRAIETALFEAEDRAALADLHGLRFGALPTGSKAMVVDAGTVTRKLQDCFVGCFSSAVVTFGDVHLCTRNALNLQHIYGTGRVSG